MKEIKVDEATIVADQDFEAEKREELAIGLKIPTSMKTPVGYLDGLNKFKDIYNDIYQQMEVSSKLYKFNSIVGNAVDVLIDFAVTPLRVQPTGNKQFDKVLKHFLDNVNNSNTSTLPGIYPLCQEVALEWFTSGNVFPYTKWENVKVGNTTYKLPMSINLINPQSIDIPSGPIAFGQEIIYLKYDSELMTQLTQDGRSNPEAALIKAAIPRSILNSLKKNPGSSQGARLNPKYVTHLKRRSKSYQPWGTPYLSRCFDSVTLLERIRQLDNSIAAGLINLITVFKIGTEEHPASPHRLKKFAALLRNPKATQTLVWAHDVDLIQVGPDGKVLAWKDKYKDAKEDVLIALGIPPVLTSLNQSGDEWVSILSLIERLSHWRKTVSIWLEKVCEDIGRHNEFKQEVKIKWERMNLADEQSIKNLVLSFYDRGLISIKTALRESNYDIEQEHNAKKEEKEIQEDFLPPNLPFSGSNTEVDKSRPKEDSTKEKTKKDTKSENTVDLKEQKKKKTPKPTKK